MKTIKILFLSNFLLICSALIVSGQITPFPNELKDYKLYGTGKLKTIKLLVSDEKDTMKIFGKNCDKGCDYNDNWRVSFRFLGKGEYISETGDGREKRFYVPTKYVGKLSEIHFLPKKHIPFGSFQFSSLFHSGFGFQTGDENHPEDAGAMNSFTDEFGLKYVICSTTSVSGRYQKGDVFSIDYETDREEIFGVHKYDENENRKPEKKKIQ